MTNIKDLIRLMLERGVAQKADLKGVNQKDIANLEKFLGLKFPPAYLQFLQNFGRSAGYLSPWMDIYFDDLKNIRSEFELLLASQNKELTLPSNAFIIGNWESIFDYIICDENTDPVVYRIDLFNHDTFGAHQYSGSYSKYLENMVESADTSSIPCDFFNDADTLTKLSTI